MSTEWRTAADTKTGFYTSKDRKKTMAVKFLLRNLKSDAETRKLLRNRNFLSRAILVISGLVCFIYLSLLIQPNREEINNDGQNLGKIEKVSKEPFHLDALNEVIEGLDETELDRKIGFDAVYASVKKEEAFWNQKLDQQISKASLGGGDDDTTIHHILYWNEAYGSTRYGFCCGREPFVAHQCQYTNCHATDNRTLLGHVRDFDAIVFHQRELVKEDLPGERDAGQRYVMFMLESPAYPFGFQGEDWSGFFNWTMTYRRDSDLPMLYGHIDKVKGHHIEEDQGRLDKVIEEFGKKNTHLAKKMNDNGKVKVAWFVSNCETVIQREKYVNALKRHVQVDIFGACGPLRCSREKESSCWDLVEREYHFYLSLENSICKDYVTEKFFNAMARNVIPVALGGADYDDIAPYHSHLKIFRTPLDDPAELGRALKSLASDPAKYASYFWWKDHYEVVQGEEDRARTFCDLCRRLNEDRETKTYDRMDEWWERKGKCRKLRIKEDW